jgi:hypothetical protein
MSTPTPAPAGPSGVAGMTLGDVSVEVEVTPQEGGDVACVMSCNGREVAVTYEEDGGVMVVAETVRHHFTAKALNKG